MANYTMEPIIRFVYGEFYDNFMSIIKSMKDTAYSFIATDRFLDYDKDFMTFRRIIERWDH